MTSTTISALWQYFKSRGQFWRGFGKTLNLLWQFFYAIVSIFTFVNGQCLKNNLAIWLHCQRPNLISIDLTLQSDSSKTLAANERSHHRCPDQPRPGRFGLAANQDPDHAKGSKGERWLMLDTLSWSMGSSLLEGDEGCIGPSYSCCVYDNLPPPKKKLCSTCMATIHTCVTVVRSGCSYPS